MRRDLTIPSPMVFISMWTWQSRQEFEHGSLITYSEFLFITPSVHTGYNKWNRVHQNKIYPSRCRITQSSWILTLFFSRKRRNVPKMKPVTYTIVTRSQNWMKGDPSYVSTHKLNFISREQSISKENYKLTHYPIWIKGKHRRSSEMVIVIVIYPAGFTRLKPY